MHATHQYKRPTDSLKYFLFFLLGDFLTYLQNCNSATAKKAGTFRVLHCLATKFNYSFQGPRIRTPVVTSCLVVIYLPNHFPIYPYEYPELSPGSLH